MGMRVPYLPESEYVILSGGGVIMADIGLGNDANAQVAIDEVFCVFLQHRSQSVGSIGVVFFYQACQLLL